MTLKEKNIKPFHVYTENSNLYIKNINGEKRKICNNIHTYYVDIDSSKNIHISCISTTGRLVHLYRLNSQWRKNTYRKYFYNLDNITQIKSYIVDNYINLFVCEKTDSVEKEYKVTHFNFNRNSNIPIFRYNLDNTFDKHGNIQNITIDKSSNLIFEYSPFLINKRKSIFKNSFVFDSKSRKWINKFDKHNNNLSELKEDLIKYHSSIKY